MVTGMASVAKAIPKGSLEDRTNLESSPEEWTSQVNKTETTREHPPAANYIIQT